MRILVASDSFKETLTSFEIGEIIARNLQDHQVDILQISDGGEGMLQALEPHVQGEIVKLTHEDPLRKPVEGAYLLSGHSPKLAVIESAVANGLGLINEYQKDPLVTSTYGVGELIRDAIQSGAKKIIVGIGGSSTNDCGIGMLEALGVKFFNSHGKSLCKVTGKDLDKIVAFDTEKFSKLIAGIEFEIACDVDNPLLGENGATYTFGPQKGANKEKLKILEQGMENFKDVVERFDSKADCLSPGAGAAGGMGFCFESFFAARLRPGIELILDAIQFNDRAKKVDLIVTGEGKLDVQSERGKVPYGVFKRALELEKRVVAVCAISEGDKHSFEKVFSVVPSIATKEKSMANPVESFEKLVNTNLVHWISEI